MRSTNDRHHVHADRPAVWRRGWRRCRWWRAGGAAWLGLALCTVAGAVDQTTEVQFAQGARSSTVSGSVTGYDTVTYTLGARAGQTASILFAPRSASCYFNLMPPGDAALLHDGSSAGNEYADKLPATGTYRAQIYLMRTAARRNETCSYRITFEITG